MKVNLGNLAEVVERKQESVNVYEKFGKIVSGVARKYGATKWLDVEEVENELWIKLLEVMKNSPEEMTEKMAARICYNKAVDLYRYARRRYDSKAEYLENYGESAQGNENTDERLTSKLETGEERLMINECLRLFPKGSREWKFVVMKLYTGGLIEGSILADAGLEVKLYKTNADIAFGLGYHSPCPGSFQKLKRQIEAEIHKLID